MAEVATAQSYSQRYQIALFRLAEIDAGIYGASGRRYRPYLLKQIAELRTQACGRRD